MGYMFNEHIGFELGGSYFGGSEYTMGMSKTLATRISNYVDNTGTTTTTSSYTTQYNSLYKMQTNQIRLTPSLVLSVGNKPIAPYCRIGAVLPVSSTRTLMVSTSDTRQYTTGTGTNSANNGEGTIELNDKLAVGVSSAVGVKFNLSGNLSFFGEVEATALSTRVAKGKYLKSIYNGVDQFAASGNSRDIVFVDEITPSSNAQGNPNYDPKKPLETVALTSFLPIDQGLYNTIGLQVGLRYGF